MSGSLQDQLSQLVYSTEQGRIESEPEAQKAPEGDGILRLSRQTKGRKGKGVTLIDGFQGSHDELLKLAKQLKQKCSVGGAVKDWVIELQGDQRERIKPWLEQQGFQVKLAGG